MEKWWSTIGFGGSPKIFRQSQMCQRHPKALEQTSREPWWMQEGHRDLNSMRKVLKLYSEGRMPQGSWIFQRQRNDILSSPQGLRSLRVGARNPTSDFQQNRKECSKANDKRPISDSYSPPISGIHWDGFAVFCIQIPTSKICKWNSQQPGRLGAKPRSTFGKPRAKTRGALGQAMPKPNPENTVPKKIGWNHQKWGSLIWFHNISCFIIHHDFFRNGQHNIFF